MRRYFGWAGAQNIIPAAIGALDFAVVPHIEENAWMAEGTFAPIACDFGAVDDFGFRRLFCHGISIKLVLCVAPILIGFPAESSFC
jgi:hypothetical protein